MESLPVPRLGAIAIAVAIVVAFAPLYLLRLIILWRHHSSTLPLPPGTSGLPVFGETLQFINAMRKNKFILFVKSRVAKYGDVFRTSIFLSPTVIVHGAEANRFLYSNEGKLVREWLPAPFVKLLGEKTILVLSALQHRRLRRLVTTCLCPEALQKFVAKVDMLTQQHFAKQWMGRDQVTLYPLVRSHTLNITTILLVGLDHDRECHEELSKLVQLLLDGLMAVPIYFPWTRFYQACVARNSLAKLLHEVISERRRKTDEGEGAELKDLISLLVSAKDEDGNHLTHTEIEDLIIFFLVAGHETTNSTVAVVCKFLCENPTCYKEVLEEQTAIAKSKKHDEKLNWGDIQKMSYTWAAIQETMRMEPPIPGTMRVALKDFEFGGVRIPRGWKIFQSLAVCYLDERYFPNPQKFDPSRFLGIAGAAKYTYYPFGGGPHLCPGMDFARMMISVFLHNLVTKFKWTLVNPKEQIILNPLPLPADGLPIRLEERIL